MLSIAELSIKGRKLKVLHVAMLLVKLAVVALAGRYIYLQIFAVSGMDNIAPLFNQILSHPLFAALITSVVLLMFVNWTIEIIKWKLLAATVEPLTFWQAAKGVLCGVTFSIITPNRIGEFAGRIADRNQKGKLMALNVVSSFSQLIVTLLMGLMGCIFLIAGKQISVFVRADIVVLAIAIISLAMIWIYFNIASSASLLGGFGGARVQRWLQVYKQVDGRTKLIVMALSALRYVAFTVSFVLVLVLCSVKLPMISMYMAIAVVYVVMAVVPTSALSEIGLRGSVSVYVFSLLAAPALAVFVSAFVIWIINLALPATAGAILLLRSGRINPFRKN